MNTLIYAAVAIAILILAIGFVRKSETPSTDEVVTGQSNAPSLGSGRWLHLSERIFDPADARWLEDELAFPKLAKLLTEERKRLAIHWLEALKASFDEVVRTAEVAPCGAAGAGLDSGWNTLWLTLRFQALIYYALFVVKVFGPYHRLIPSSSWVPFYRDSERRFGRQALASSRIVQ